MYTFILISLSSYVISICLALKFSPFFAFHFEFFLFIISSYLFGGCPLYSQSVLNSVFIYLNYFILSHSWKSFIAYWIQIWQFLSLCTLKIWFHSFLIYIVAVQKSLVTLIFLPWWVIFLFSLAIFKFGVYGSETLQ